MKKIFFLFLIINGFQNCFSKAVDSFYVDIERNYSVSNSEITTIKCNITLNTFPFELIYHVTYPENQYIVCKENNCYIYDNEANSFTLVNEAYDLIKQTAMDICNWFSDDFNLSSSGYQVSSNKYNNNLIISEWIYKGTLIQPICKIISHYEVDHFNELSMYTEEGLFANTKLQNYQTCNNIFYPSVIITDSHDSDMNSTHTELLITNVNFNKQKILFDKISEQTLISNFPPIDKNLSKSDKDKIDQTNQLLLQNDITLGTVCVNGAYLFYKKFITAQDMSACSFYPTCSQYMKQAVQKNGIFGIIQGYERYKRCTSVEHKRNIYPITKDNKQYDPVP